MDNQTRHALKSDSFVQATASSVNWLSEHRSGLTKWVIIAAVAIVVVGGGLGLLGWRSAAANTALNAAMDTYTSEIVAPGAPVDKGTFATTADRAKAANQKFVAVASQYGMLQAGTKAHYFAGVTYMDLGQNGSAESELKIASGSWNRNIANLGKLALANLYHRTSRDSEAIELYKAIIAKPSDTVTAASAQLGQADLLASTGKMDEARKLWATIKDADKEGAAGMIATQKLGAK